MLIFIALIYLIPALVFIASGIINRDIEEVSFVVIWPVAMLSWLINE